MSRDLKDSWSGPHSYQEEKDFRQREEEVRSHRGRRILGVLKDQQGACCGWSRGGERVKLVRGVFRTTTCKAQQTNETSEYCSKWYVKTVEDLE